MTNSLDAKIAAAVAAHPETPADTPDAGSAPDALSGAPPTAGASSAESASGASDEGATAGAPPESPPGATNPEHELLAEKLRAVREANRERREKAEARRLREEAEREAKRIREEAAADRDVASKERARWEHARKDYKSAFAEMGLNPREVYEEMTRQAIEAGTPEAQLRAAQEAWKAEMEQTIAPLKSEVEKLRAEREELAREQQETRFANDFQKAVRAPEYESLLDEYPEHRLLGIVRGLVQSEDSVTALMAEARRLNVPLTDPNRGVTMQEILSVLKATQDEHEAEKQKRRAARTAATTSEAAPTQAPSVSPTVNGTAEKRNAGSTLGNDLASSRASDAKPPIRGSTPAQRLRERVRRLGG